MATTTNVRARKEREVVQQAAEAGDALAAVQLKDMWEEAGRDMGDWGLHDGQQVTIYTATLYYRGILLGEDHEYYVLGPGAEEVYETGPLETFHGGKAALSEIIVKRICRVRKGATVSVIG